MKNRSLAIAALILVPVLRAGGQPADRPLVAQDLLEILQAGSELRKPVRAGKAPELIPESPWKERIASEVRDLEPTIGVEVLLAFSTARGVLDSPASTLALYNLLRSISRMKGIEYYSASRKRMRTLFAESYVIDDPLLRRRLPDPLATELSPYDSLYMLQEDLTFGENIYRSEYLVDGGALGVRTTNLSTMRYLLMPMVQPERSLTWMIVVPYGKGILFYGLACARTASLLGLERAKEDSFYNRLKAIYGWFTGDIARSF